MQSSTALGSSTVRDVFDPEALERGARALREIQKSPHAKSVIELSKQQEITRQQDALKSIKEAEVQISQKQNENEKIRYEQQRLLLQEQAKVQAKLAEYEDQMSRKRMDAEHEKKRQRQVELLKMQDDSNRRKEQERLRNLQQIETERRRSAEFLSGLEAKVQKEKVLAKFHAKAIEHRENADLYRDEIHVKLEHYHKTTMESLSLLTKSLGRGITEFPTDGAKMTSVILVVGGVATALYGAREGIRVTGLQMERWLGTPDLIRETSRNRFPWIAAITKDRSVVAPSHRVGDMGHYSDVILRPATFDHVRKVATATANSKRLGVPFRHMLFHGPPGTGKTLTANLISRASGLDYAIMSGSDVTPLGSKAVTKLHSTFDWATRSRNGIMLFIDEADAFLSKRSENQSEGLRSALNAMLYHTGGQSKDLFVVLATNRPGDLDKAVLDRVDEHIEFALPGVDERKRMLELFLDKYLLNAEITHSKVEINTVKFIAQKRTLKNTAQISGLGAADILWAAEHTEGFSGRELAKLISSVQSAVSGSRGSVMTPELFYRVVRMKIAQHVGRSRY